MPKKEKWVDYVNKNIRGIYETFTVEKVKASTTGNLRDILYDKGELKPFNEVREQLIEYYAHLRKNGRLRSKFAEISYNKYHSQFSRKRHEKLWGKLVKEICNN